MSAVRGLVYSESFRVKRQQFSCLFWRSLGSRFRYWIGVDGVHCPQENFQFSATPLTSTTIHEASIPNSPPSLRSSLCSLPHPCHYLLCLRKVASISLYLLIRIDCDLFRPLTLLLTVVLYWAFDAAAVDLLRNTQTIRATTGCLYLTTAVGCSSSPLVAAAVSHAIRFARTRADNAPCIRAQAYVRSRITSGVSSVRSSPLFSRSSSHIPASSRHTIHPRLNADDPPPPHCGPVSPLRPCI